MKIGRLNLLGSTVIFQKGAEVKVLEENYMNFYGGSWTRVEWNDNWYWVNPKSIKKVDNDE